MLFTTRATKSTRIKVFPFIFALLCILLTSVAYADMLTVDTSAFTYDNGVYSKNCVGRCIMYYTICKEAGQPPMLAHEFYSTSGEQMNTDDVVRDIETHYRYNSNERWQYTEPVLLRAILGQTPNGECINVRFMFRLEDGVDSIDYVPVYDRPYSEYAVFLNLNDQIAYYEFDVDTLIEEDVASSNANGTRNGSPIFTSFGLINNAYNLTPGDFFDMTDRSDFTFSNGGGDDHQFSISMWLRPNFASPSTAEYIISKYDGSAFGSEFSLYHGTANRLQFYIWDAQNDRIGALTNTGVFSANEWYHVVVTYNGTNSFNGIVMYINNDTVLLSSDSAGSYDGIVEGSAPLTIGATAIPSLYYTGIIDEVAIFNSTLNREQVAELYNDGLGLQYPYGFINDTNVTNVTNVTNATGVIVNIDTTEIADSIELLVYIGLLCILAIGSIVTRIPFMYVVTGIFGIVIGYTFIENTTIALIIMIGSAVFMILEFRN